MPSPELKKLILQAGILAVLTLATACGSSPSSPVPNVEPSTLLGPALKIEPSASAIQVNDVMRASVKVVRISNLIAYEAHLSFDPNVLEVTGLNDGGFVKPDFIVQNTFDNAAGTIDYAAAQIDRPPANGGGALFEIVFRAKAPGQSPIIFRKTEAVPEGALLSDPNGIAILVSLSNGSIEVGE